MVATVLMNQSTEVIVFIGIKFPCAQGLFHAIYIFDLISSWRALSLSISVAWVGQPMIKPSSSLGLGIYFLISAWSQANSCFYARYQ